MISISFWLSKYSLDIEQYVEFKMSVLISPSKSLIISRWVTYGVIGWQPYICGTSEMGVPPPRVSGH